MTRVAVLGATGRMGQTLVRMIAGDDELQLVGAATEPGHPSIGEDAAVIAGAGQSGVSVTDDLGGALADAAQGYPMLRNRLLRILEPLTAPDEHEMWGTAEAVPDQQSEMT